MKRIKDNTPLNYKDNEQIEDMIFEKVSAVSANDFDDRYGFHNVAKGTGLTIRLLDKDMNELGYTFVRQTEPMGYDLCRVYKKDNIDTYVFLNEVSGVDERNKPLNGYYTLVCANSYYKNGVSDSRKIKDGNYYQWDGLNEPMRTYAKYAVFVSGDKNGDLCEEFYLDYKAIKYAESLVAEGKSVRVYKFVYSQYGEEDSQVVWENGKDLRNISDSRKIKDANDTPLNGLLSIAFNDGTEDEMCKTVQQHANEQGEIDGIQYETYETDEQDGVAFVDLCAIGVSDATEFVKALLKKWGVLENTADIDFDTQTEEEYNEEVSDSRKIGDMTKPAHLRGYADKVRAKRRNKSESRVDEPENEKQDVADSRIRDGFATRYDVAYNEDPYKLAQRIAKNGTISTRSRHQRPHDVNVNKDTIFHVYNDRDYSYDDFMTKYGVSDSVSIDEPIDYNEVKSVSDELHYLDVLRSSNLIDGDYMGQGEIFEIIESIDEARLGLQYCLDDFLKEFKKYENGDSDDWRDYAYQARDYFEIFEEYCNEYVKNSGRGVEYFNAITDTKALLDKIDTWL